MKESQNWTRTMIPKTQTTPDRSSKTALALAGLVLFFESATALAQCPAGYTVQILEGPQCGGGNQGHIYGVGLNDLGEICGYTTCPPGLERAIVSLDGESFTHLAFPPGTTQSFAFDRNNAGVTVGDVEISGDGYGKLGFLRDGETFITLGTLTGGTTSEVAAINSENQVCGMWGGGEQGFLHACRWVNNVIEDISQEFPFGDSRAFDISDTGIITGWMAQTVGFPPNYRGFIWNNGKVIDLGYPFPGAFASEGLAVNSRGDVAGRWWRTAANPEAFETRAFLWRGGQIIDLGTLGNFQNAVPLDINDAGIIVGRLSTGGVTRGFVWSDGVFRNLSQLIPPNSGLSHVGRAWSINEAGQVLCEGLELGDHIAVLLTPLPSLPGDTNCDSSVNVDDLLNVIGTWGGYGSADLNNDGIVNVSDLLEVIINWDH